MATSKYRCLVCGYIYDSDWGDPDTGVLPGTVFLELPAEWTCPICGAGQSEFEEVKQFKPN